MMMPPTGMGMLGGLSKVPIRGKIRHKRYGRRQRLQANAAAKRRRANAWQRRRMMADVERRG
jgi:hypothetical protein